MSSLDDAQVASLLARERATSIGRRPPSDPAAEVIPGIQAQATATESAIRRYYEQVLGVLSSLGFPVEVAARHQSIIVKYYPADRMIYISSAHSITRERWDQVPPLLRAKALPALSALWTEAKKKTLVSATDMEASLAKYKASGDDIC